MPVTRWRQTAGLPRPISTRASARRRVPDGFRRRASRDPAGIRALPVIAGRGGERLEGRLYNEYALGSRIQYQVRVGEQVFIVEKLRQQAYAGNLDDEVLIGWDADDCILVDAIDGRRRHRASARALRNALPVAGAAPGRLRRAAASRSSPSASCRRGLSRSGRRRRCENYRDDLREHELHLVPLVARPGGADRRAPGARSAIRSPTAWTACSAAGRWR